MGVGLTLLLVFVFSGIVHGDPIGEPACPPTIVDCACTEKDGNFYTIQINTTTVSISDEDTGLGRCIADGDPLALCEDRNCIIIPNDNFKILFRMGKKMSPSNYLKEDDLVFENKTSSIVSKDTDPKAGSGPSEDLTSSFYPIELTYPRMIHGEEAHQLVKRNNRYDSDGFIPPPAESDFGDENYGKRDSSSYRRPSDSEFGSENYRKKGAESFRSFPDLDFGDEKYKKRDPDSFRPLPDSDFADEKYGRNLDNERRRNISLFSDIDDSPPMRPKQEEIYQRQSKNRPTFIVKNSSSNSNTDPVYWGGNYGYTCRVPQLKNSEVTCWKWPNWQTCKQTCIYGHGIASQQGTVRSTTYTCRNTENQWKPQRMVDCQPYLNCKVRLRSPGDLKCVEPTNRPAYCDIACEEYDNNTAQRVRVTCDEKQGGMRLPFCATLDSTNMNHVRAPSA